MNSKIMRKREVSKMQEYINTLKECLNEIELNNEAAGETKKLSNEKLENVLNDVKNNLICEDKEIYQMAIPEYGIMEVAKLEKEVERKLENLKENKSFDVINENKVMNEKVTPKDKVNEMNEVFELEKEVHRKLYKLENKYKN